jgi:hypothetical protein
MLMIRSNHSMTNLLIFVRAIHRQNTLNPNKFAFDIVGYFGDQVTNSPLIRGVWYDKRRNYGLVGELFSRPIRG